MRAKRQAQAVVAHKDNPNLDIIPEAFSSVPDLTNIVTLKDIEQLLHVTESFDNLLNLDLDDKLHT